MNRCQVVLVQKNDMVAHLPLTGELGWDLAELCSAFNAFRKLELLDLRGNMANSGSGEVSSPLHKPISLFVPVADNGLGVRAATQLARVLPDNCRLRVIKCKWYSGVVLVCVRWHHDL